MIVTMDDAVNGPGQPASTRYALMLGGSPEGWPMTSGSSALRYYLYPFGVQSRAMVPVPFPRLGRGDLIHPKVPVRTQVPLQSEEPPSATSTCLKFGMDRILSDDLSVRRKCSPAESTDLG